MKLGQWEKKKKFIRKALFEQKHRKGTIQATMGKIWKISKISHVQRVESNLFTITFDTKGDKPKVLDRKP